ncbi:MAG: hypothetical protein WCD70_02950 [Alphaproteobacteria bacterium]
MSKYLKGAFIALAIMATSAPSVASTGPAPLNSVQTSLAQREGTDMDMPNLKFETLLKSGINETALKQALISLRKSHQYTPG